jgi:nucleotide-binding universal stress UspA family protein
MKIILAPTDFSKTARNAINYAAEIAKRTKSKLVLIHAYHPPVVIAEAPIVLPLPADFEKDCMKRLKKIRYDLVSKHGRHLDVDLICQNGLAADIITEFARSNKADLVVVGTHGAGYLEEKLLGSVTWELIKSCPGAVLSIPSKVKFKSIKNIVLATDYGQLKSATALDPLKDLASMFKSHIYILNVIAEGNGLPTTSQAVQGIKLEHVLEAHNHSFHSAANKDVVNGINEFVAIRRINMTVMLPRRHSFVQSIFKKSNSKAMAFHTETPLLTIHP